MLDTVEAVAHIPAPPTFLPCYARIHASNGAVAHHRGELMWRTLRTSRSSAPQMLPVFPGCQFPAIITFQKTHRYIFVGNPRKRFFASAVRPANGKSRHGLAPPGLLRFRFPGFIWCSLRDVNTQRL